MRKDLFNKLVERVREMRAIRPGSRRPARVSVARDPLDADTPDVSALRASFGLSQAKFAALLGIGVDTRRTGSSSGDSPLRSHLPEPLAASYRVMSCRPHRYRLAGTVTFAKKESGWQVAGIKMSLPDGADSSRR